MMLSPEVYRERLKDLSKDEILREIRSLKRHLSKLKRDEEKRPLEISMADDKENAWDKFVMIDPSPDLQIEFVREYLFYAILAYENAGGKYKPSKAEIKAKTFQENIPFISEKVRKTR
jgi:hypothetical protein